MNNGFTIAGYELNPQTGQESEIDGKVKLYEVSISTDQLYNIAPKQSLIVTLIQAILQFLQDVFNYNCKEIIKYVMASIKGDSPLSKIYSDLVEQFKGLRDGLVKSMKHFKGSIDELLTKYEGELQNIYDKTVRLLNSNLTGYTDLLKED